MSNRDQIKRVVISEDALKDQEFLGEYIARMSKDAKAILLVIDDDSSKYTVECIHVGDSIGVAG